MKRALYEAWMKALESGEYKQTYGVLKDNDGYCCLGVLCAVAGVDHGGWVALPLPFAEKIGMQVEGGAFGFGETLSALNDRRRLSFPKIAAIIRKDPLVYIKEIEEDEPPPLTSAPGWDARSKNHPCMLDEEK